jgi:hypothetical protein
VLLALQPSAQQVAQTRVAVDHRNACSTVHPLAALVLWSHSAVAMPRANMWQHGAECR